MQTPIYQNTFKYSHEEFIKYRQLLGERSLSHNTIVFNVLLAAVGFLLAVFLKMIGAGISFILLAIFNIAVAFVVLRLSEKRAFSRNKTMWTCSAEICLYEEYVSFAADNWKQKTYDYDDFYKILESDDRIYMIAGPRDILILDKENCSSALVKAITSLPGYKEAPF